MGSHPKRRSVPIKLRLGAVLQCGGRGRRLGKRRPKPLVRLLDGATPLGGIYNTQLQVLLVATFA